MSERVRLPAGTSGLAFEDSVRRQEVMARLSSLFGRWGYIPVSLPIVDFYEVYRPLVEPRSVYRLTDREGDLLLLRNDATLFLARLLALHLSGIDEPLRLWYAEEVVTPVPSNHPVSDTGFQAGAEFLGLPEGEADWEIVALAAEALTSLGLTEYRIHLGSRALFHALIRQEGQELDRDLIRDVYRLSGPRWETLSRELQRLLTFIGSPEEALERHPYLESLEGMGFLVETFRILSRAGLGERLVIDLGEIGTWSYYSGLVFKAYVPGAHEAVVSGGRYDGLLRRFGIDAPSVGFSLQQGLAEALRRDTVVLERPSRARGEGWLERFADACRRRTAGERVVL